jgi:opacity protein-like surface antigen
MKRLLLILVLLAVAAVPSHAITGISLGARAGLGWNFEPGGLTVPGVEFDDKATDIGAQVKITTLPIVDFIFAADYIWKKKDYEIGGTDLELKISDFALTASVIKSFNFPVISPYAGGGIGNHHLSFQYTLVGNLAGLEVPGSTTELGYHVMAGVDVNIPMFPLSLTGEYRHYWVDTEERTKFHTVTVGANFKLP